MRKSLLLLLIPLMTLVTSCEVEFSPNAEWKEVPIVYCVLDQDDDTSWVRVEKCFLGEGNMYQYGAISDSINYPEGSLEVSILAMRNGNVVDSIPFQYATRNRQEGRFASQSQPGYFSRTAGRLKEDCTYVLNIRHTADGSLLASATTNLVIKSEDRLFDPYDDDASRTFGQSRFTIVWPALTNGRRYQPLLRFFYRVQDDTLSLDFMCGERSHPASRYKLTYNRNSFLDEIKERLSDDATTPKYIVPTVDVYLVAANEDLNAYLNAVSSGAETNESLPSYSNIQGGVGVFGSRRTHLKQTFNVNTSDISGISPYDANAGFRWCLKQLGIGFEG